MMAACVCTFTSCDDWTEPEHIDLDYGTIDTSDPAAYEKYLANLREYRQRPLLSGSPGKLSAGLN